MANQTPRPLLLKMIAAQNIRYKKLRDYYAKHYALFFLLGAIAGYSLAMILITGDFYWMPWKEYDITVKPPTNK